MENNKTQYWKGLDELHNEASFEKQRHNEFAEKLPLSNVIKEDELGLTSNRRDFLKFMGFSISAATLAACSRTPVKHVIPYVIKPQEIDPGIADYYATTCNGCQSRCSLLVKTREGRPIKIEGNDASPFSRGGVCAVGQGTVLSLYDDGRLAKPMANKKETTWDNLYKEVSASLKAIAAAGGQIRLLTGTINSPSALAAIKEFTTKYPTAQHVSYDAVSSYALKAANGSAFGKAVIPNYKIENADVIVSFGADFLGTWISPVEYTKQYVSARNIDRDGADKKTMLHHIQFESTLSLSGSNADQRFVLSPSQYGQALVSLHNQIAAKAGKASAGSANLELAGNSIKATADRLWAHRGKGIVISDSNNIDHQLIIASINSMLGNIGSTIDLDNPSYQREGNDKEMIALVNDLNAGKVDAIFIHEVNPAYSYPDANKFTEGLKKAKLSVAFSDRVNETSENAQYIAPDNHFLESWGDAMPKEGYVSLYQPTISPIFDTRQMPEVLLRLADNNADYHEYIRNHWQANFFGKQKEYAGFEDFWAHSLEKGFMTAAAPAASTAYAFNGNIADAANRASQAGKGGIEVVLYEKVAIRDGKEANNPWLQEVPDPIAKISWDNYAAVSPKWAEEKGLTDEDTIDITSANGYKVTLPIYRQPGQRYGTIAIAFGYGRKMDTKYGKVLMEVGGANAYPFATIEGDTIVYGGQNITVSGKTGTYELALSQTHNHIEGRNLVMETTIAELAATQGKLEKEEKSLSIWRDYRFPGHHWGMAVDLNACTGCNACVVSCVAENNVAVVGKDEVRRRREMHWIRIDRYYTIADKKGEQMEKYKEINKHDNSGDIDYENVKVMFQPVMCQHCSNAPCETVCPVNAISHSSEGLNQQVYNRCVGTKYCANNCPYKVRRFNWFAYYENDRFDYNMNSNLGRMVLNPDVVVRSRGVMEKCSFCVQRVQMGKLEAKKDGRAVKDGDVKTACMQTCPANAIVFGDLNDPNSQISKLVENKRAYGILKDLGVRPNVTYMARVRSTEEKVS
jgi:molybdopterin-containing oxidoreductase family iron-sulfur binding subunit